MITADVDPDHPCLPCIVIAPCQPGRDIVIRCGNCGTETHFHGKLGLGVLRGWVEEHCAAGEL